jgi:hypothetical protein
MCRFWSHVATEMALVMQCKAICSTPAWPLPYSEQGLGCFGLDWIGFGFEMARFSQGPNIKASTTGGPGLSVSGL